VGLGRTAANGTSTARHNWLRVELGSSGQTSTLTLRGTLSGTSVAALDAQVDQLGPAASERIVVDMSHLRNIDHNGARAILALHEYVSACGGSCRIVGANSQVAVLLCQYLPRESVSIATDHYPRST
jgi:anti-anti-sigma regulatory factor